MKNLMKCLLIVGAVSLSFVASSCETHEKKEVKETKVEKTNGTGDRVERTETRQSE